MSEKTTKTSSSVKRVEQGVKLRGADKVDRIPVKVIPTAKEDMPRKPDWLRVKMGSNAEVTRIKTSFVNISFPLYVKKPVARIWANVSVTVRQLL